MRTDTVVERTLDRNALDVYPVTTAELASNSGETIGQVEAGSYGLITRFIDTLSELDPKGVELRRVIELCYAHALRSNVALYSPNAWPAHVNRDTSSPTLNTYLSLYTSTGSEQDIIQALRLYGKEDIADRIAYLHELASEDPMEDRLMTDSLRNLARVMTNYPSLPYPTISVSPDGHAVAEWSREYGILAMEFTNEGTVRYAALPRMDGYDHLRIDGERPASEIMEATSVFVELLTS